MGPITSIKIDACLNYEIGREPWPSGGLLEGDEGGESEMGCDRKPGCVPMRYASILSTSRKL
jgi:hypothetical protein